MLKDVVYYGGIMFCMGSTGFFFINYLYPNTTKRILFNSVKVYHYIKREINNTFQSLEYDSIPMTELTKEKREYNTYLGYKVCDDTTHECNNRSDYFNNEIFDLMIVIHKNEFENEEYYRILSEKNDIEKCEFKKSSPLFLQVEIEQLGERKSIHEFLKPFYLDGNVILSKTFLEWYLKKFYYTNLDENYKLHLIDTNVNLFSIDNTQEIEFVVENNELKYKIKLI
jgi:hypothetical protein